MSAIVPGHSLGVGQQIPVLNIFALRKQASGYFRFHISVEAILTTSSKEAAMYSSMLSAVNFSLIRDSFLYAMKASRAFESSSAKMLPMRVRHCISAELRVTGSGKQWSSGEIFQAANFCAVRLSECDAPPARDAIGAGGLLRRR